MSDRLKLGEYLYRLLPEVYRTRDRKTSSEDETSGDGSLSRYLDAHGHLLDLIHATLEQQLKDTLPESSQEWLLPYFARLLAADIVSPDLPGKRAETAHAVTWRQRKGTLQCAEEIAELVGQMEVEIQEGWKRVAMTPRIGIPLIPAAAHDSTLDIDMNLPFEAIHHPSLPGVMVDIRRQSRAVEALPGNPAAADSDFGGIRQTWRQANRHGAPCFSGSFEDLSRRTVDIRTPDAAHGWYHHKRLLLFSAPATGFFGLEPIKISWNARNDSLYEHLFEQVQSAGTQVIRNRTKRIIEITDPEVLLNPEVYRIEGINFTGNLHVPAGGKLELNRVEASKLTIDTFSTDEPVLTAGDCLFGVLSSAGMVKLDSCTVLETAFLSSLDAQDCIFMDIRGTDITGTLQYCRIPENTPLNSDLKKVTIKSHQFNAENKFGYDPVTDLPVFISNQTTLAARSVLSPNAPKSIYQGAGDHKEMGYYHRGRQNKPVHLSGDPEFSLPTEGGYPLADVIFDNQVTVQDGQLALIRSAAPKLTITASLNTSGDAVPSLTAADCLFQSIDASSSLIRLEYCTIMETTRCRHIQASDCIFAGRISGIQPWDKNSAVNAFVNCIRYSSIHSIDQAYLLTPQTNTRKQAIFNEFRFCTESATLRQPVYGEWGYGVPGPLTSELVRFGAEDGGAMGAYHHLFYTLRAEAMLKKMREFLPVGIEPVLIEDERLLHVPPEKTTAA